MEHIPVLGNNSFRACCWAVGAVIIPRSTGITAQARGCEAGPTLTSGHPPAKKQHGDTPSAHPMFQARDLRLPARPRSSMGTRPQPTPCFISFVCTLISVRTSV